MADSGGRVGTLIIGSGFAGLCMAIRLARQGRRDFLVLEKADDVGGTWRDNTYPGCACDVPSQLYSFSFERNPHWSSTFSGQPEIWRYLRRVADSHGLSRHIRFGVEVTSAAWDAGAAGWRVATADGEEITARFLVSGVGALHVPSIPPLPGLASFRGAAFHSSRWDHGLDLRGKRVAVVGTGASAIQFIPEIAGEVERLDVYQRTPPWVLPRADGPTPGWARSLFRRVPAAQRAARYATYWALESAAPAFNGRSGLMRIVARLGRANIRRAIADPGLRRAVTPGYTPGCKRILMSNTYYPALARDNVEVVTDAIGEVREHAVVTADGTAREADAIIFGTGFHVTDSLAHFDVLGRDGTRLADEWESAGTQAHLGITVAGFPNLFLLLGPNTGLGHNSVVFMIESQVRYAAAAMRLVREGEALQVRRSVQDGFNADIQRRLGGAVWSTGGCGSWYLDSHGANRALWPGFASRYWLATRRVRPADFEIEAAPPTAAAGEGRA